MRNAAAAERWNGSRCRCWSSASLQLIDPNRRGKALLERQQALRVVGGKVVCGTQEQTDMLVRAVETPDLLRARPGTQL